MPPLDPDLQEIWCEGLLWRGRRYLNAGQREQLRSEGRRLLRAHRAALWAGRATLGLGLLAIASVAVIALAGFAPTAELRDLSGQVLAFSFVLTAPLAGVAIELFFGLIPWLRFAFVGLLALAVLTLLPIIFKWRSLDFLGSLFPLIIFVLFLGGLGSLILRWIRSSDLIAALKRLPLDLAAGELWVFGQRSGTSASSSELYFVLPESRLRVRWEVSTAGRLTPVELISTNPAGTESLEAPAQGVSSDLLGSDEQATQRAMLPAERKEIQALQARLARRTLPALLVTLFINAQLVRLMAWMLLGHRGSGLTGASWSVVIILSFIYLVWTRGRLWLALRDGLAADQIVLTRRQIEGRTLVIEHLRHRFGLLVWSADRTPADYRRLSQ